MLSFTIFNIRYTVDFVYSALARTPFSHCLWLCQAYQHTNKFRREGFHTVRNALYSVLYSSESEQVEQVHVFARHKFDCVCWAISPPLQTNLSNTCKRAGTVSVNVSSCMCVATYWFCADRRAYLCDVFDIYHSQKSQWDWAAFFLDIYLVCCRTDYSDKHAMRFIPVIIHSFSIH